MRNFFCVGRLLITHLSLLIYDKRLVLNHIEHYLSFKFNQHETY
ncbi:MAG: hypothetical protein JWN76_1544 [Chitinophagaceae bacterium]|nr:hypothetical protein [Chitinophagaceae bacterium]